MTSSVWLQLALKAAKNKLKSVTTKIRKLNVTDERVRERAALVAGSVNGWDLCETPDAAWEALVPCLPVHPDQLLEQLDTSISVAVSASVRVCL